MNTDKTTWRRSGLRYAAARIRKPRRWRRWQPVARCDGRNVARARKGAR